jgi:hypothetical protein
LSALGVRITIGVMWLALVLLAYYAVHKPVTAQEWQALLASPSALQWRVDAVVSRLGGALLDLVTAAALLMLGGALGSTIWRVSRLPHPDGPLARLSGTILGLGMIGLVVFMLGLLGWLSTAVMAGVLLALAVGLWRDLFRQTRWWVTSAGRWWCAVWAAGGVERMLACFVAAMGALVLLAALLPPTAAWDALSYHLVAARQDALHGRIVLDPGNPQLYQPELTEMLFAALYLLRGGDGAAAPLHAGAGVVLAGLIAWWGWRVAGPRGSVRAAALLVAIPVVTLVAGWPYVDLMLAAAEVCALLALVGWSEATRAEQRAAARGLLVLAGVFGGLALDVKYTAAYTLAALSTLVLVATWVQERDVVGGPLARVWRILRPVATFAVVGLLVGSPWLIRNLLVAGDPLFPYHLGPLFPGGPGWDAGRTVYMEGHGWGVSALWRALALPFETILLGQQGSAEFDATLGPLLLLLLPLGALTIGPRRPRGQGGRWATRLGAMTNHWLYWPLGLCALITLCWAEELARSGVAMQSRLYLIVFVALVVPAAVAWLRLGAIELPSVSLARLTTAGVALCLVFTLVTQAVQTLQLDNLAELVGAQPRGAFEQQQLGPYAAAMRRVDALPASARVLLLWEPRSYLAAHAQAEPDVFLDALDTLYRHCGKAGITRCLREQGFTYVLCYQQGMEVLAADPKTSPTELSALRAAMRSWHAVYHDDVPLIGSNGLRMGWYVLYALGPAL